jgi:hypothetical protein
MWETIQSACATPDTPTELASSVRFIQHHPALKSRKEKAESSLMDALFGANSSASMEEDPFLSQQTAPEIKVRPRRSARAKKKDLYCMTVHALYI